MVRVGGIVIVGQMASYAGIRDIGVITVMAGVAAQ